MHILNNSWIRNVHYDYELLPTGAPAKHLFEDCQREIFRSQTVFVAARGNDNVETPFFPSYAKHERWVLSVGGSNEDGNKYSASNFGQGMDVIAPHNNLLNYTLGNASNSTYHAVSGTSFAAAHVSGLAGLMLSHINDKPATPNRLAPDDVEFLIQRYAKDREYSTETPDYLTGYDKWTGWGLVDAGNVMQHIDRSQYIIKHVTDEIVFQPGAYTEGTFLFEDKNLPWGLYNARVYTVTHTMNNNLLTNDDIIDYWPLDSYATLQTQLSPYNANTLIDAEKGEEIISMDNQSGTVTGKVVHITSHNNGTPHNYWYPVAPGGTLRVGYSLHLRSDYASVKDNNSDALSFTCYPNPATNRMNVRFSAATQSDVEVEVHDINGRLIYKQEKAVFGQGQHEVSFDTALWMQGIYFVTLNINGKTGYEKIIKQ